MPRPDTNWTYSEKRGKVVLADLLYRFTERHAHEHHGNLHGAADG